MTAAAAAPPDAVALKPADLIANINELTRDAGRVGIAVWERYEGEASRQAGYYLVLGAVLTDRLTEPALAAPLAASLLRSAN